MIALMMMSLIASEAKPVELSFEDQFEAKQELKSQRGKVVVLIYGDRKASDACKSLGEQLHVAFHPTAKGLSPAKSRLQPVTALPNAAPGQSPGVLVQAVACCGKMPALVRPVLKSQIAKASPDVPVWLDFEQEMVTRFGMTTGEANAVVFDVQGRYRHAMQGTPDAKTLQKLAETIQSLRVESVKP
jgi:hypothetical protein